MFPKMSEESDKPLYVKPEKRWENITTYCYACQRNVSETCRENGKHLKLCPHGDRHIFKGYFGIPDTNRRITKTLGRDYVEAVKMAIAIKQGIKNGEGEAPGEQPGKTEESKPVLLINAMARYVGILNNDPELVPDFKREGEYSKKHIEDVKRSFKYLMLCADRSTGVNDLNDQILGKFCSFLLQERQMSHRSYNKTLTIFTTFYNHLLEDGLVKKNPFKTIPRKKVFSNPEAIEEEELKKLLQIIQKEELGRHELPDGTVKSFFKPWMKDAILLGAFTGRRNFEITMLKWNDIQLVNGEMGYIKVLDYKVNRQQDREGDDTKFIYIPVIKQLRELLVDMGYEKYKDSDKYILAPEETMQRDTINSFLTRSFSHYYQKLDTGKSLSYKCLRKTYISQLVEFMGIDNARIITRHSGTEVMEKHYIDKKYISLTAQGFKMFGGEKGSREKEMEEIRSKPNKEVTLER